MLFQTFPYQGIFQKCHGTKIWGHMMSLLTVKIPPYVWTKEQREFLNFTSKQNELYRPFLTAEKQTIANVIHVKSQETIFTAYVLLTIQW